MSTSDLSHLASALDNLSSALWLSAESQYDQTQTLATQLEKIMATVQLDDSVLTTAASTIETLVTNTKTLTTALTTFLQSPAAQQIPAAQLDALNTALADAETEEADVAAAQQALQDAANGTTPPAPNSASS